MIGPGGSVVGASGGAEPRSRRHAPWHRIRRDREDDRRPCRLRRDQRHAEQIKQCEVLAVGRLNEALIDRGQVPRQRLVECGAGSAFLREPLRREAGPAALQFRDECGGVDRPGHRGVPSSR
jgi:hypothetical protein